MKKYLPLLFIFILALTGIAAADAPFEISVDLAKEGVSYYNDSIILFSGNQLSIRLDEYDVVLTVQEKQDEGLNFAVEPDLESKGSSQGVAIIGAFLLPEGDQVLLSEPGKDDPVLTISWKEMTLDPQYENLIGQVTSVLAGEEAEGSDFSAMFRMLAGSDAAGNTGFYVTDLDSDGVPELFFGENYPVSSSTVFYDMYTLVDGELVHVFDGWDRSRYYLCENGGIAHEGSSSAFESSTGYYYFTNGELKLMQALVYNSRINPEKPWYLSTASETEPGAGDQPLDESEALYMKASYPYKLVELDPFIK